MNWVLFKNSLLVSGFAALLATGFGFIAALWANGLTGRVRRLVLVLAILSLALPPFLVTNSWLHFLGQAGVWRKWLPFNIVSQNGTAWILATLTWPIPFFAVLAAWQNLERYQIEADPLVRGWNLVRYALLPLAAPALLQGAIIALVLALNNFAVPAILQVKVFPAETWVRFSTNFDALGALQISWPLILVPLLLLLWLRRRHIQWPRLEGTVPAPLFRQQLGQGWFWLAGIFSVALAVTSAGLPLWQLLSVKRTWTELPGALAAGQAAIWDSAFFAVTSATLCLGVSLAVVAWKTIKRGRGGDVSFARSLLWLPFLTPGVLLGILLISLFNHGFLAVFYQSAWIVILALLIRYFGPGWTTVSHALDSTDRDLEDVARLEGASRWQMLRHVQWPQVAPQISAIWYVLFLLCLWDVESLVLIVPPGHETIALRIFNLLHYGHNAQVNALCLTLLLMALVPLAIYVTWSTAHLRTKEARL